MFDGRSVESKLCMLAGSPLLMSKEMMSSFMADWQMKNASSRYLGISKQLLQLSRPGNYILQEKNRNGLFLQKLLWHTKCLNVIQNIDSKHILGVVIL